MDPKPEERGRILEDLQNDVTLQMIPAMTYLVLLGVIGLIGNSLVLFVYSRKFRRNPTRIFILAIASFDIVTNTVVIPGEIYDMFHIYDFNFPYLCKVRLFFNAFTTMAAAMVLVAVAVAR
ncbi:cannabinoid receptor 2-like [Physella acuta]|uniref:cannabinoid receptor 2-like n=1 Tax=Physella acuta TaxID=109671 RepID=UPI0027DE7E24|nr:cannabinoid receptor 2-like [Physella acuta]